MNVPSAWGPRTNGGKACSSQRLRGSEQGKMAAVAQPRADAEEAICANSESEETTGERRLGRGD
jgi:hypothetical protein